MARKPKFDPTGRAAKLFAALLALCVWQLAAALIHNRLLLVGPVQVARRVIELLGKKTAWEALGFTFGRISLGFFLAFLAALVLAALSARFPWVETLLRPYILAVQTVPVASFIVIALLWLSSRRISAFIAFLMVLPVLYANALQGIREADPQLLEMARVFRLSGLRRVRCIILPSLAPYLESACHVALGLCWKAGVAAEVMAVANRSVGGMLYDAKVYLEISDLFAWTVLLVAVSILFEKEGKFTVVNKNLFANTDRFRCVAVLQKNGVVVKKQEIETAVPPLSTKDYEIPFAILRADDKDQKKDPDAEYTLTVSFRLKNTGKRNGDEVAQVYVRIPETGGIVPLKELKGFRRVPLKSGESRRVEIKLNKEQLRYWDVEKGQFVVPKGAFDVMVGASSKDIRLQTVIDL